MTIRETDPLSVSHPSLAEEWDFDENILLTPDFVSSKSNKKAWWKCIKGHKWEASIRNRANGSNCPYCSGRNAIKGETDLSTTNPELAQEWNHEKNAPLEPSDVKAGSNLKVWWTCKQGHHWQAVIASRSCGNGCPYCSNRKLLVGYNDLETINPEIAKEWNYPKNAPLKPCDILPGSNSKIWWIDKYGHEWQDSANNRTSNDHGCPYCSNHRVLEGVNDLATLRPDLAMEWNYEKNKDARDGKGRDISTPNKIAIKSGKKVWWRCARGHEWLTAVENRINNSTGCPICGKGKHSSFAEQAVFYYTKLYFPDTINSNKSEIDMELDIYIPSKKTAIEYDGSMWHKNMQNDINKNILCHDAGIRLIRIREEGLCFFDDCICIQRNNIQSNSSLNFAIKQALNFIDGSIEPDIDVNRDSTNIFQLYTHITLANSIANTFPEIARDWHPTKNGVLMPSMFSPGTNSKVWWLCSKGHEYNASIVSRTKMGSGCPYCSIPPKKILVGFNDLQTKHPVIAAQWHPTKNGSLLPTMFTYGSSRKVWWLGECGHEFYQSIVNRVNSTQCPVCIGKQVQKGKNDLLSLYPKLSLEWNYGKNNNLLPSQFTPHSNKSVWWKCSHGHEFKSTIANRVDKKVGCPYCSGRLVIMGETDLQTLYPQIASEWNYNMNIGLKPTDFKAQSNKKVWWKCPICSHEWKTSIYVRTKMGCGCPRCGIQKSIGPQRKSVICVETGVIYESVSMAEAMNNTRHISDCCLGKRNLAGGYHWKFYNNS